MVLGHLQAQWWLKIWHVFFLVALAINKSSSHLWKSVCQRAFSLLAIWCLRGWWVRILLSTEEDNLSPFDLNINCLCQSIEINNNKQINLAHICGPDIINGQLDLEISPKRSWNTSRDFTSWIMPYPLMYEAITTTCLLFSFVVITCLFQVLSVISSACS